MLIVIPSIVIILGVLVITYAMNVGQRIGNIKSRDIVKEINLYNEVQGFNRDAINGTQQPVIEKVPSNRDYFQKEGRGPVERKYHRKDKVPITKEEFLRDNDSKY